MQSIRDRPIRSYDLAREIRGLESANLRVVYSVCDLGDLRVRALPDASAGSAGERVVFADAPERAEDFVELAATIGKRVVARGTLEEVGGSSVG